MNLERPKLTSNKQAENCGVALMLLISGAKHVAKHIANSFQGHGNVDIQKGQLPREYFSTEFEHNSTSGLPSGKAQYHTLAAP